MRRLALLLVAALVAAIVPMSLAGAGAGPTTDVEFLHGLGNSPGDNPVDVYVGDTDATSWDLELPDQGFADFIELGFFSAGGINVLLCEAVPAPNATITGCADNDASAINGNFGTNVDIPAVASITLVAAYDGSSGGASGRPTVTPFENDITCVEPGNGRLSVANAGMAGEGDVLVDGTVEGTIDYGDQLIGELAEGLYDVTLDADVQVDSLDTPVDALVSSTIYAVGNPQFEASFQFISTTFDVPECAQPTTTTTTTPPTTVAPQTPVARPVAVTPAFTG
jgi:hypothetical protein